MRQPLRGGTQQSHEANESMGSVDEFLAIISHELRIPISAILGWVDLLDNEQIDKTGFAKAVEVIKRNASAQAQLIEEIADYSRLGADKLALTIRKISLAQIVKAAIETLEPIANKKTLQWMCNSAFQGLK